MKLIVKSSKLARIFTSCNVYSNEKLYALLNGIVLSIAGGKRSLNLSNSYTQTANQSKSFFIASYLIVENYIK